MAQLEIRDTFHTGLTVADLDSTLDFLCGGLGYELMSRAPRNPRNQSRVTGVPDAEVEVAYVRGHGHELEILEYKGPADRKTYEPRPCDAGHWHLCLVVNDIEAALEMAKKHGLGLGTREVITVDRGPNKGNEIFYADIPGGFTIEFTTRKNA